jgi:hypothetical protein
VVTAYILIQTEVGKAAQVAREVVEISGVQQAEDVTGPYDVIVRAEARNINELGRLVVARVQAVDGITRTLTCPVVHLLDHRFPNSRCQGAWYALGPRGSSAGDTNVTARVWGAWTRWAGAEATWTRSTAAFFRPDELWRHELSTAGRPLRRGRPDQQA